MMSYLKYAFLLDLKIITRYQIFLIIIPVQFYRVNLLVENVAANGTTDQS